MKSIYNIRKTAVWLGIVLPLFMLLIAIWVNRSTNGQFNASFDEVTRTYNVLNLIERTQTHIADAETGRRGYLLTGRENYATLRDTSLNAATSDIQQLGILVRGGPESAALAQVQMLVSNRLASISKTTAAGSSSTPTAADLKDDGLDVVDKARNLLFQIRAREAQSLTQSQAEAEKRILIEQTTFVILVAVTAITLIAGFIMVLRLEQLHRIVTICAWTGQVKDGGEWVPMENYLKQRFGLAVSHGVSREAAEKIVQESRQPPSPKSS